MSELDQRIVELKASRASLAQLESMRAAKESDVADLQARLVIVKAGMGERILMATLEGVGDATETAIVNEVSTIGARIEAATSLIGALDKRITMSQASERHAQAEALRAHAAQLRREAQAHRVKTDALLAELEAHEGCSYMPEARLLIPEYGGMVQMVTVTVPQTAHLLDVAAGYIADADAIEHQQPIPWSPLTGKQYVELPAYLSQ